MPSCHYSRHILPFTDTGVILWVGIDCDKLGLISVRLLGDMLHETIPHEKFKKLSAYSHSCHEFRAVAALKGVSHGSSRAC